jgi:RpiR family transcriptional regulator, repressor of rpiB and als operon
MPRAKSQTSDDPEDLEARIQRLLPQLTPKQHRLARTLLSDQMMVAFASAEDVGRMADVDSATVVRFSRLVGYEGFADLRDAVRRRVPEFLTEIERVSRSLESGSEAQGTPVDVCAQDIRNIEQIPRANPADTFDEAVAALDRARRVFCLAQGVSAIAADYMTHQLALIGVDARRSPRDAVEAAVLLPMITPDDVVVVFSVWRYLDETLRLCNAVRRAGATIISLVDNKAAPVVPLSDVSLVASTVTPKLGHSLTGFMTLVNALATGVASASPGRALDCLTQIEEYYTETSIIARNGSE